MVFYFKYFLVVKSLFQLNIYGFKISNIWAFCRQCGVRSAQLKGKCLSMQIPHRNQLFPSGEKKNQKSFSQINSLRAKTHKPCWMIDMNIYGTGIYIHYIYIYAIFLMHENEMLQAFQRTKKNTPRKEIFLFHNRYFCD